MISKGASCARHTEQVEEVEGEVMSRTVDDPVRGFGLQDHRKSTHK